MPFVQELIIDYFSTLVNAKVMDLTILENEVNELTSTKILIG